MQEHLWMKDVYIYTLIYMTDKTKNPRSFMKAVQHDKSDTNQQTAFRIKNVLSDVLRLNLENSLTFLLARKWEYQNELN